MERDGKENAWPGNLGKVCYYAAVGVISPGVFNLVMIEQQRPMSHGLVH